MHYSIPFSAFQDELEAAGVDCGAAEAHGILCGILSAAPREGEARWSAELADRVGGNGPKQPLSIASLDTLSRETRAALVDKSELFHPLQPAEARSLGERAAALRDWSSGFLYGLGLNRLADDSTLSAEAREGLQDLAQIARMAAEEVEESEDEEQSLAELLEYVRVVAALLVDELIERGAAKGTRHAES